MTYHLASVRDLPLGHMGYRWNVTKCVGKYLENLFGLLRGRYPANCHLEHRVGLLCPVSQPMLDKCPRVYLRN